MVQCLVLFLLAGLSSSHLDSSSTFMQIDDDISLHPRISSVNHKLQFLSLTHGVDTVLGTFPQSGLHTCCDTGLPSTV